jgi:peptidyl-prolyl cis-trans isomerase C
MYKSIAPFIASLVLVISGCQSEDVGRPMPVTGEIVASVNGVDLSDAELNLNIMARQQMRQAISPEDALKEIINIELIRQAAVKQDLQKDPQVAAEINRQATGILVSAYIHKLMESNADNQAALQKAYDDYVGTLPNKEYKARHILSKTKEEAVANIKALKAGKNFAKLAKEKSLDQASSGGDLGWSNPENYVPEFSTALQALEPGKYSQEPVQTQFGWHVILLEETRETKLPGMEEMRAQLQRAATGKLIENNIEELRKTATIDIKQKQEAPATNEPAATDPGAPAS